MADLPEIIFIYDHKRCLCSKRMTVHIIPTQTRVYECILSCVSSQTSEPYTISFSKENKSLIHVQHALAQKPTSLPSNQWLYSVLNTYHTNYVYLEKPPINNFTKKLGKKRLVTQIGWCIMSLPNSFQDTNQNVPI